MSPLRISGNILNTEEEATRQAFTAPDFTYWLRPENLIANEAVCDYEDK